MSVWSGTIKGAFDFMVDTGSDITALTTIAFKRFRFQPRNVGPSIRSTSGIAETAPTFKFAEPVKIHVLDANGKARQLPDFQLYAMETSDRIPCILGRDFLARYGLTVHFNPLMRSLILEGPDPPEPHPAGTVAAATAP